MWLTLWLWAAQPDVHHPPLPARIEWAIEYSESRGVATCRNGPTWGVWQVDHHYASHVTRRHPHLLFLPAIGRAEGRRMMHYWLRKSRGDMRRALAAYQCGYGGLSGKCGQAYASTVLGRAKNAHWSVEYLADHCQTCPECCVED